MSWWPPVEVDERTVMELQRALDRVVQLGAEAAVVRVDGGELIAAAERPGWLPRRHHDDGRIFSQRLWRSAAFGVFARTTIDIGQLEQVAGHLRQVLRSGLQDRDD